MACSYYYCLASLYSNKISNRYKSKVKYYAHLYETLIYNVTLLFFKFLL